MLIVLWGPAAAEVSVCPDPSERMMTVWIFFGSEEGGARTGAGGGTDAVAGGATAGGGAAGAGAMGTAPDPRALGGEALGLGEIGAVFFGGS